MISIIQNKDNYFVVLKVLLQPFEHLLFLLAIIDTLLLHAD